MSSPPSPVRGCPLGCSMPAALPAGNVPVSPGNAGPAACLSRGLAGLVKSPARDETHDSRSKLARALPTRRGPRSLEPPARGTGHPFLPAGLVLPARCVCSYCAPKSHPRLRDVTGPWPCWRQRPGLWEATGAEGRGSSGGLRPCGARCPGTPLPSPSAPGTACVKIKTYRRW